MNFDPDIFLERTQSQDRAIEVLQKMGYEFVSRAEADVKRYKRFRNVLFMDELRKFLASQTFRYKGRQIPFSERTIGNAIRDIDVPLQNGLMVASKSIYNMLLMGKSYEEMLFDGTKQSFDLPFIDWEHPEKNIWQVTEEFTVERENQKFVRPDIVILINGIPLVVIECKSSCVDVMEGVRQNVRNGRPEYIPHLFKFVQIVMAMNPNDVRYGTCGTTAPFYAKWQEEDELWLEKSVWKYIPGHTSMEQDRVIVSLLSKQRLFSLIRHYVFYDSNVKKIARYQQFFGVENILRRIKKQENANVSNGVVWHTQGSGKSLTMVMLVKKLLVDPEWKNARFVLVCDRVNLVKQLRDNFIHTGLHPVMASTGRGLVSLLQGTGNIIVTTTVQKFKAAAKSKAHITDSNIILLVDESHRSHTGEFHSLMLGVLPNAIKIGFTGTPLMKCEESTFLKFGPLIGRAYKFADGIRDGVIVPLVYEGRMVEQELSDRENTDDYLNTLTEPLSEEQREHLRRKWSKYQKLAETKSRLSRIAFDIHHHFLTFCQPRELKAMVVASSRPAAIELAQKINSLGTVRAAALICPTHKKESEDEELTSQDIQVISRFFKEKVHPRFGMNYEKYEEWVKNNINGCEQSNLDIVVVRDMLLTGFDAPALGVLYVDKKMKDHTLLQAIARVNRIYPGKDFGLIVDYFGVFGNLSTAMDLYQSETGALGDYSPDDLDQALTNSLAKKQELLNRHQELCDLFKDRNVDVGDTQAYINVFSEEDNPNATALRKEFYELLRAFSRLMMLALSNHHLYREIGMDHMGILKNDLRFFHKLRATLQLIYGEKVDFSQYENGIRALLDTFVEAAHVTQKVPPVMIHDTAAMDQQLAEIEGCRAKAAYIKTRLVAELEVRRYEDPLSYKNFSQRIQETLDEYRQLRDDTVYLQRMQQLANDFRQGLTGNNYPLCIANDSDSKAFYGIILEYFQKYATKDDLEYDESLGKLASNINEAIRTLARVDWHNNNSIHKKMTQAIEDFLWDFSEEHSFELSVNDLDKMLESIKKTAFCRY
ncbi:MAG: HsdR family type I site-specific deoxyribonuclease [Planctomycetia bacterium]|nr:HsdR family type I site-specific deoxyribonuclease [Planctomycetia bacterium]